jgi:hypothetical protein
MVDNPDRLRAFAEKRGWQLKDGVLHFKKAAGEPLDVPSQKVLY